MNNINKLTPEELSEKISKADIETIVLLNKFEEKTKKSFTYRVQITSFIATVAGFSISLTYFSPDINKLFLSVFSVGISAILVFLSYLQHKKDNYAQISKILKESESPSEIDKINAEEYRAILIDSLKREER